MAIQRRRYRTKSGVLVEERGRKTLLDAAYVAAYRVDTGKFHGWCNVARLTPVGKGMQ